MLTFGDIINQQIRKLNKSIRWWPLYLYHFTDVHNAVNIIDKEYIYGRKKASDERLMSSDNASSKVIHLTNDEVLNFARLYMRPKTPTQYHNEGYKPPHIRDHEFDANCPVPVFFLLDSEKVLSMEGVKFIEKGLAGNLNNINDLSSGAESFNCLNFDKIFHDGPFQQGSDIKQYRHTEVVRKNGIPIPEVIRGIACRSIAEKQTLLYLLKKTSKEKYMKYKNIIMYKPNTDLFLNNGIFVKEVIFVENKFEIHLNDSSYRLNKHLSNGNDVYVQINLDWLGDNFEVIERNEVVTNINYKSTELITISLSNKHISNTLIIEIRFDGFLMYQNRLKLDKYEMV